MSALDFEHIDRVRNVVVVGSDLSSDCCEEVEEGYSLWLDLCCLLYYDGSRVVRVAEAEVVRSQFSRVTSKLTIRTA